MLKNNLKNYKGGFTFIEIMVSILILATGVILLLSIFPVSLRNLQKSKDVTLATFLAQTKMEELRNYGQDIPESEFPVNEYEVPNHQTFTYKVEKLPLWNSSYKEIKVSVSKKEKNRQGQLVPVVYAQVGGLAGGSKRYTGYAVLTYQGGPTYHFVSDTQDRCILYCVTTYGGGGGAGMTAGVSAFSSWIQLPLPTNYSSGATPATAYLPSNGVPGEIRISPDQMPGSPIVNQSSSLIFVYDTSNKRMLVARLQIPFYSFTTYPTIYIASLLKPIALSGNWNPATVILPQ